MAKLEGVIQDIRQLLSPLCACYLTIMLCIIKPRLLQVAKLEGVIQGVRAEMIQAQEASNLVRSVVLPLLLRPVNGTCVCAVAAVTRYRHRRSSTCCTAETLFCML